MQKKLSSEQMEHIIETGIQEFSLLGCDRANINTIAKKAGVSVGVLYKYFDSKDDFFEACLKRSLQILQEVLEQGLDENADPKDVAYHLARVIQESDSYADYTRMYHMITTVSDEKYSRKLAQEIEQMTAETYKDYFAKWKERGALQTDVSPEYLAFFFDNMLMMLQFSYCCPYYKERYEIYTGRKIEEDDLPHVFAQMLGANLYGVRDKL